MPIVSVSDSNIYHLAAERLRCGEIVAFPTETVYGLGASAMNPTAVKRIFELKGRPANHPLIVHIGDVAQLDDWALNPSDEARLLAEKFFPGPLTLILPKAKNVPDCVTGGQDTVGIRMPNHPAALALLKAFGGGISAPSANKFGKVSPTTAMHVYQEFGDEIDLILDGGSCEVGIESTILDMSGVEPIVLRPGGISVADIIQVLKRKVFFKGAGDVRAPGTLASHYQPSAPVHLLLPSALQQLASNVEVNINKIAVITCTLNGLDGTLQCIHLGNDAKAYAKGLYAALRELDSMNPSAILIELPPNTQEWFAVRDRLEKAKTEQGQHA